MQFHRGFLASEDDFSSFSRARCEARAVNRARYHFGGTDSLDPDILEFFARILQLSEKKGAAVRLVSYPVSRQYYRAAVDSFDVDPTLAKTT